MERPANMMPNGMPPQGANMNSMQRPQPGNPQQQIHAQIMTNLRGKMSQLPPGWQSTFDIGQRAQAIMQLVSNLRILESSIEKCISIAASFEERLLNESPSREVYMQRLAGKLQDIKAKREQQMQNMQFAPGQMNMQMNNGMGMGMQQSNVGMANLNMMQNNGMGGIGMGMNMPPNQGMNNFGGNGGQQNQGFPAQLQRPMQASPLPPQQQQGQPSNGTLDPSALHNNQMTNFGQPNQQPQQNMNTNPNAQGQQPNRQQQQILAMVTQMMNQTPDEKKSLLRQQFLAQLDEQKRQQLIAQKRDPLQTYFTMQASEMLRKRAQQAGQASQQQQGNGMQMGGVPMQQSASQSSSAPQFDFTSMLGQQANAIKSQESGEQVVPASNNNNNSGLGLGGGQMNMSQGVNPQAVTNQNGQVNNNAQLQQLLAAQQEKARRDQMQQQNQTAQNQAMSQQQAQQLRGQPGGLNAQNAFNNGQVNSPAMNMNMLNRPMAPPGGQPAPSTPQQPRPGMAQTPMNPANQLAQHHQNMLNQNNQQNQQNQGIQGVRSRDQLINSLPPAVREKLAPLSSQQVDAILAKYVHQNTNANNQQGANMANRPMNGAQAPLSGIPGNMGSAVPTFNSQPNQQQAQQGQQAPNEQLQQRLQQHQSTQLRQRALDLMPLPKAVLPSLSLAVPDSVNSWGKLKQHITQNQAVLPPNILQKLHNTQQQYYEQRPDEVKQAVHSFAQQMQQMQQMRQAQQGQANQQQQQQQQQPVARPPSSMAMPNGQAPQAQMVPPTMQQQQHQQAPPANANQQQIRIPPVQPPTMQEIQAFRQQIPHAQNISDEQVRNHIMQRKAQQANALAIQAQQQQNLRNQMQRAQALTGGQQNNVGQQANAGHGNQTAQPPRPQQPQAAAKQQANNQAQGQKRQQSDDVVEIPKPVAQAQTTQANQSQQLPPGMRMPSREEFLKLPIEQQQLLQQRVRQMEALRKAQTSGQQASQAQAQAQPQPQTQQQQQQQQQGPPMTNNELQQRLRAIYAEVVVANPKGPSVQLDAKSLEQAKAMLKKLYPATQALGPTLSTAMRAPNFGEQRVREAIRNLVLVQNNATNANGDVKDYLSLNISDLRQIELFIARYFSDMKALREQAQAANGAQQQQAQARPQQQPAKTQEQPATKPPQAARKASAANTKAPPAPTENKKFDWGSPSPHGVPKYEGVAGGFTSDKLKLPANKKRKTNQAESQESKAASQATASGAGSPKSVDIKSQSQEQTSKTQPPQAMPKAPEPEKAKWKCDDTFCDASVNGFETEAQLKEHKETAHQPITDPMQYMLDNAAKYFGVDQDGNPLPEKKDAKAGTPLKPANKKELPGSKRDSATPASNGKAPAKSSSDKPAGSVPEAPKKEQTLMERMCENIGFELPVKKEEPTPPNNSNGGVDDDSWLVNLSNEFDEEVDEFGGRPGWLPSEADWAALPKGTYRYSPEPTPSSDETSQSSHTSDISMNEKLRINFEWDAFGNGDTYVPEILRLNKLGLSPGAKTGGDVAMLGGDGQSKSDDAQKKDDPWDWSEDVIDYDAFFDHGNDKLFDASEAF